MTIERIASFSVRDLRAVTVTCAECKAVVRLPIERGYNLGDLHCPRCPQDGSSILWTGTAHAHFERDLVVALFEAAGNSHSTVGLELAVPGGEGVG